MPVIEARIDQRLIHGIVVNQWNSRLNPKRFMVVDDVTGMSIIDFDKASTNFKNGKYDNQKVFLIVKEPSMILKLMDAGVEIPKLNLGIIFAEDGRTNISKFINLNKAEVDDLKEIESRGVPIRIQYIHDDTPVDFNKAIEGHDFK